MSADFPDPNNAPELFEGVLTRRIFAYFVDVMLMVLIGILAFVAGILAGVFSGGALLLALPIVVPASIVAYYALTLGSPARATIGMRLFDIVLTPTRSTPIDGWRIIIHPAIFWVTCWILPLVNLLFALLTPRRQMIHDLITGTLMVRRSPMERHWANV